MHNSGIVTRPRVDAPPMSLSPQLPSASESTTQVSPRKSIPIDFCDFGPGFRKDDNFFYNTLRAHFNVVLSDSPDYLIYCDRGSHVHRIHNCVKINFCNESYAPDWTESDYALTCRYLDDPRHLRFPYYLIYGHGSDLLKNPSDMERLMASKTKFCSFIVSNGGKRKTQKRVDFFHLLSQYKRVDSGGRHLNNIGGPIPGGWAGKIEFLKPYKFNIAFENASIPGYTTEKLFEAMQALTVPIYWGNPRVAEEFNPHSFLNAHDFPSEEALIEKIIELDCDDAKYLQWLQQPYFHNNQPNEYFNQERLVSFFDRIFSTPIRPVSQRRRWFQFGRWIPVKKNHPH